jgi:opacity protein-like surface antigen
MLATGEFAMKETSIGLMLGAAVLAAGCASQAPQPTSMRDPQADFNAYETFALKYGPSGDASSKSLSIVEGYIRAAITAELKGKGYVEAAAGTEPDLRIEYEAASEKKLKNNPFRIGVGVGGYGSNVGGGVGVGSPSVKNVTEGTLVIHAVDPVRKAEVWQGRASRELGNGNIEPAVVQAGVAELLRDFPARSGKP